MRIVKGNKGKSLYFTFKGKLSELGTILAPIANIPHKEKMMCTDNGVKVIIKGKEENIRDIKEILT